MIDEFSLLKSIGKGAFGEVFLTSKEGTNQLFATKKVSKQKVNSPTLKKYFFNEISILKEINHKNIIHFEAIKHTVHNFYIITEYCNGGGLSDCLLKYRKLYKKPFSEEIVQHVMRQIVEALKYLHGKRIIHRDIKLDNILVNFENEKDKNSLNMLKAQIKMIDFGFATHLGSKNLRYSTLGSPINMDPILLKKLATTNSVANLIGYDEKADIWSLGTVCYEMLIGQGVFNAQNMVELIKKVEHGTYHVPTNLSIEVVSFLNGMLQYSAKNRLSAEELSRHHFLTKNVKDFRNIDLTKVSNKIDNKGLNINIKRNQSIWAIFKEEDEKTLIDIPGKYLVDAPIKEQDEYGYKNENPFKKANEKLNKMNVNNNNKTNNNKVINININNNVKNNVNNNNVVNNNVINNVNNNNNVVNNNAANNNLKNINNIKNVNNNTNKLVNTKEKNIDYNLLKQQQKLYYQLNLKNNNYQRFANYTYNNPYGFGGTYYNNYYSSNQPKYYNAKLDGTTNLNNQVQIPIQGAITTNNNLFQQPQNKQILINQQNQQYQYQYPYTNQPQYNPQNKQIVQNPIITQQPLIAQGTKQPLTQAKIKNQNIQIQKPVIIPDNNKNDKNNKMDMSNISNVTTKTMNLPIGSRMPQQDSHYSNATQKMINLESPLQKQNTYHQNQINQNNQNKILSPQNQNKTKLHVKKLKSENFNEYEILNQQNKPDIQKLQLQRKHSENEQQKKNKEFSSDKNQINQFIKTPTKENKYDIKKYNKMKSNDDLAQIKEPKNNSRKHNNKNEQTPKQNLNVDYKNIIKDFNLNNNINENINNKYNNNKQNNYQNNNKTNYNAKVKKIENKPPVIDERMYFPFDGEENDVVNTNDTNNNNNNDGKNNEVEEFNEPFPMPSDDESLQEKKNSKNISSSDELDNLIDFKLGDELCSEPGSIVEKKSDEFDDKPDDNNLDLPMKKIMERTVDRPTIGVPPPGTDPNNNYDYDDDDNNGVFQSNIKLDFDNFEEI